MENSKIYLVLYHKYCVDGLCAAVAAYDKFGDTAYYRSISYGDKAIIPGGVNHVIMVDYSPSPEQFETIIGNGLRLTVIDHHQTALDNYPVFRKRAEELGGSDRYVMKFSLVESGATLARKIFSDENTDMTTTDLDYHSKRTPLEDMTVQDKFFNLIRIRDLWIEKDLLFSKDNADSLHAYIRFEGITDAPILEAHRFINRLNEESLAKIIEKGSLINAVTREEARILVRSGIHDHYTMKDGSDFVVCIVLSHTTYSECGDVLRNIYYDRESIYIGLIYHVHDNTIGVSMRSSKGIDLTDLCKFMIDRGIFATGGGHKQAAGAKIRHDIKTPIHILIKQIQGAITDWTQD